ncbi:helix-turn-helix domain-containing protein [Mameliella alba]|uniref:helix-turn-helix domain-containing protein n=1 Tax=Mameliella alba TaxID=561184 RepID=UPI0016163857|nr:helix-turn-helix transcriptional regulator [Mameliella alba]
MTPEQCRAARALIGMTQPELAKTAGLGLSTIVDFEKTRRALPEATRIKLKEALEASGVIFIEENGGGIGVRIKK